MAVLIKRFSLAYLTLALLFVSCDKQADDHVLVQVNKDYCVELPTFLKPVNDLHELSACQYGNDEKELYFVLLNVSKQEISQNGWNMDLEQYFNNVAAQPFAENISNGMISDPVKKEINQLPALTAEITGEVNGSQAYYKLAVIETESDFYQLLVWTRADKKDEHSQEMEKILGTFKNI